MSCARSICYGDRTPVTPRALREALRSHAHEYIRSWQLPREAWFESSGRTVLFRPIDDLRHGNFLDSSYSVIETMFPDRLKKPHPQRRRLPPEFRNSAAELDSSTSSDALLMNIFCHPDTGSTGLCDVLGLRRWEPPMFGVRYRIAGEGEPHGPAVDPRTELDATFGDELSVEAKLTEDDFNSVTETKLVRYARVWNVFDREALGPREGRFDDYQLIRNVLAANERGTRFLLIHDERRPDLLERWKAVREAITLRALRDRCGAVTWQAIAPHLPSDLQEFLAMKYGIAPGAG